MNDLRHHHISPKGINAMKIQKGNVMKKMVLVNDAAKAMGKSKSKSQVKIMIKNNEIDWALENGNYVVDINSYVNKPKSNVNFIKAKKQKVLKTRLVDNLLKEITGNTHKILDVKLYKNTMKSNYCHSNVGQMIEEFGGERVYVWMFTDFHQTYDLQFHSLWKAPNGELYEVTDNNHFPYKETVYIQDSVNSIIIIKLNNGKYDFISPPNIYIDNNVIYAEREPHINEIYTSFRYVHLFVYFIDNLKYYK